MNYIELHILQTLPVSSLNTGENGEVKATIFGGVERIRVSSQSWKRAIRHYARELRPDLFGGLRTRYVVDTLRQAFIKNGLGEKTADKMSEATAGAFAPIDKKDVRRVKTVLYFSETELQHIAAYLVKKAGNGIPKKADIQKIIVEASTSSEIPLSADVAIFGRFMADLRFLTVDAATMYSHALGTNAFEVGFDYFSVVDDLQPKGESGAGYTDLREFSADTIYRCAVLDLDQLSRNLTNYSDNQVQDVVSVWIEATVMAVPVGRKTGMFAWEYPAYVLGVRGKGRPASLATAFVEPIKPGRDENELTAAQKAMTQYFDRFHKALDLKVKTAAFPEKKLKTFILEMAG